MVRLATLLSKVRLEPLLQDVFNNTIQVSVLIFQITELLSTPSFWLTALSALEVLPLALSLALALFFTLALALAFPFALLALLALGLSGLLVDLKSQTDFVGHGELLAYFVRLSENLGPFHGEL